MTENAGKTRTKGNVYIEDIKVGDIHYEYGYGKEIKSRVVTAPRPQIREPNEFSGEGIYWSWKSVHLIGPDDTEKEIIEYGVDSRYTHYGPNLYTYQAYRGYKQV
jgi:hypothetical protein